MSRYAVIRLILGVAIVVMAAAVWGVGHFQASADDDSTRAINDGEQMLIAMLDQETGLRGFINTHEQRFLQPYLQGRASLETAVVDARDHATGKRDRQRLADQVAIARRWQAMAEQELRRLESGHRSRIADAERRKAVMDRFRAANASFLTAKQNDRNHDRRVASIAAVVVIIVIGALFGVLGVLLFGRPERRDAARRRRLAQLGEALQVARTEREAFDILKRYVENLIAQARPLVLIRNASQNRLRAATSLEETPIMAERLREAAPEDCLSVRLAKPYERVPGETSLLVCELCGALPTASSCVPTVVGGEVVGSVLVQAPKPPSRTEAEDLATSVAAAGPVIANLRNLAIAELRAATDNLTGLPNHRAVEETLARMVAQAGRSKTPLSAIMFDLDHFKQVNDVHGHSKGDEVLATVAQVVQATVRDSDFAGRYGGEEFIALLPDTSREGGAILAEKLREAIEAIEIPDLDQRLSASFGVAALPGDAVDGEQLVRAADRALYAAKNRGRNRVEVVQSGQRRGEPAERR